jgi:hypothetical protein
VGVAGGKQRTGLHADAFERQAVTPTAVGAGLMPPCCQDSPDHVAGTSELLY